MTVGELIEELEAMMEKFPEEVTEDTTVVVHLGQLRGAVQKRLSEPNPFNENAIFFGEDATDVSMGEVADGDDWVYNVFISGGVAVEMPPWPSRDEKDGGE